MRINFYMVGNAREEEIIIQDIYQENIWPESKVNLTNPLIMDTTLSKFMKWPPTS